MLVERWVAKRLEDGNFRCRTRADAHRRNSESKWSKGPRTREGERERERKKGERKSKSE